MPLLHDRCVHQRLDGLAQLGEGHVLGQDDRHELILWRDPIELLRRQTYLVWDGRQAVEVTTYPRLRERVLYHEFPLTLSNLLLLGWGQDAMVGNLNYTNPSVTALLVEWYFSQKLQLSPYPTPRRR